MLATLLNGWLAELVDYCDAEKIAHIPFDDFALIKKVMQEIVENGATEADVLKRYGKSYE